MQRANLYTLKIDRPAAMAETKALAQPYPNDLNYRDLYGDMLLMNEREPRLLRSLPVY